MTPRAQCYASATEQTNRANDYKTSLMSSFVFHIRHGQYASDHTIELPCADPARQEASGMCVDMMSGIMTELETNPEWCMKVSDEAGEPLYLFRFTAEAFKPPNQ